MGLIYEQEMAIREMERLNPSIEQIEAELKELEERKQELQALYALKCDAVIKEAIEKSSHEKKIERVSMKPKMVIVHLSDLIGNPWNIEFHDWYSSKDVLLKYLSTKPAAQWHDTIIELVNSAKDNVVSIKLYEGKTTRSVPISLDFMKAVLKKIEK